MVEPHSITPEDIEDVLKIELDSVLREECITASFLYEELTPSERDQYILDVIEVLTSDSLPSAGESRFRDWESGWGQNLDAFRQSGKPMDLVPRYFGKHQLVRWKQRMIRPVSPLFDYHIHCVLVDCVVAQYLREAAAIYEFGCGPGYHLLGARRFNTTARLVGLDWTDASQNIIKEIAALGLDTNIHGYPFNFYDPDETLEIVPNSGVLTVAALEQVGNRFEPFLQFLLRKRPAIVVHLEPIDELMDCRNLIDRLSVAYCRKRNYLAGYLPRLRQLQAEGKVRILREQRTYTGSFFLEGHTLVVWCPI